MARTALKMSSYALVKRLWPSGVDTCSIFTLRCSCPRLLLLPMPLAKHISGYAVEMPVGISVIEAVQCQKGAFWAWQGELIETEAENETRRAPPG